MDAYINKNSQQSRSLAIASVFCVALMSACSAAELDSDPITAFGSLGQPSPAAGLPGDPSSQPLEDGGDNLGNGYPSDLPFADPTNLEGVETTVTLADSGIKLGFAGTATADSVSTDVIETNWAEMQSCLETSAVAPFVIVSDETIAPASAADDVLHHFDGSIVATSTMYSTGATIQIRTDDLDGTYGRIGFNLRSVMGRYLWAAAGLAERDYPHSCASDT